MDESIDKDRRAEEMLETAAGEALGTNTPAESAAFQQQLSTGDPETRQADREMRQTAALLASASPYMNPPNDLRGRLLQATAPAAFRMEDYRKANRDSGRFYRWGLVAAALIIVAGTYYTMALQQRLNTVHGQAETLAKQVLDRNIALANLEVAVNNLANPNNDQISLLLNGKLTGKAFLNEKTNTAIVVLPTGLIPTKPVQLSVTRNNVRTPYNTIFLSAPRDAFPEAGDSLNSGLAIHNVEPDTTVKVLRGSMGP